MFKRSTFNLGNCRHLVIRQHIDQWFFGVEQDVAESYYNITRFGQNPDDWHVLVIGEDFGPMDTLAKYQKALFVIGHLRLLVFHLVNIKLGNPVPFSDYNIRHDFYGTLLQDNHSACKARMKAFWQQNAAFRALITKMKNYLENQHGITVNWN